MHCFTTLHGHRMVQSPLLQKVWVRVCAMVRLTITHHLQCHPTKLLDRYLVGSPKSHERKGTNTPPAYELKLPTTLPPREQIMWSTTNKKVFLELLSKCTMGEEIEITGERYRDYDHEEAGITMVGSALEKNSNGAKNVFVTTTLMFWFCWFTSFRRKNPQEKSTYIQSVLTAGSSMWRHLPPCWVPNVPSCLDCIVYQVVIQMAISFAKVN